MTQLCDIPAVVLNSQLTYQSLLCCRGSGQGRGDVVPALCCCGGPAVGSLAGEGDQELAWVASASRTRAFGSGIRCLENVAF